MSIAQVAKVPFIEMPFEQMKERQQEVVKVILYEAQTAIKYPFCISADMITELMVNDIVRDVKDHKGWRDELSCIERENIIYDSCERVLGPCE